MPRGDRTGPEGLGPMTGRNAGFCAGNTVPGFMNPAWGRGGGGRRGGGRGNGGFGGSGWRHRNQYFSTGMPRWQRAANDAPPAAVGPLITKEQELEALKNQAKYFEQALSDLQNRIDKVESNDGSTK